MSNNLLLNLSNLYTFILKGKFHSFGKGSVIKPFLNSANERFIRVGNDVNIGSFCRITVSCEFGGKTVKSNNPVRLSIGNDVDIGNNTFISANNNIVIGDHVIMAPYVFITDHDHGFLDVSRNLHEQPLTEGGKVIIGNNVFIGTKASILKNVKIGDHAIIGANSTITKNVPSYSIAVGNPMKIIKHYNFQTKKWSNW
ncbi:acyltransferase [Candidatus Roizmanbacteria bacterium]|nr:acyltransferase [Candidatus Roizmanbacteria bacterium]